MGNVSEDTGHISISTFSIYSGCLGVIKALLNFQSAWTPSCGHRETISKPGQNNRSAF